MKRIMIIPPEAQGAPLVLCLEKDISAESSIDGFQFRCAVPLCPRSPNYGVPCDIIQQ